MKIRTGFVSNSSSSSFVFALPSKPANAEELKNILFGSNQDTYNNPYRWDDESPNGWPTGEIAERVFNRMTQDKAEIRDAFRGYIEESQEVDEYGFRVYRNRFTSNEERLAYWEREAEISKQKAERKRLEFMAENYGKEIYTIEISDDSVIGSAMENGDLFNRIPTIRISHH
jgi:hypothetical protein